MGKNHRSCKRKGGNRVSKHHTRYNKRRSYRRGGGCGCGVPSSPWKGLISGGACPCSVASRKPISF